MLGEECGDLRRDTRGLLELHAGRQLDRHLRGGEIRARVERLRDRDQQADRDDEEERTARERRTAMRQRPAQRLEIALHHRSIRRTDLVVRLQDIGRHQRGDQARDQQREEHRRGDRQAELLEVLAGDASHEADRKEHGDDGGGGRHHRQTDLVRRIERRLETRLAHAHVTHDILDLDDRVIHQHTGHQRQGQHADRIEGEIHRVHEREGRDRRQRDGERGDRGRAPVAQEHQHDEHCEHRAFDHRGERRTIALAGVLHGGEHAGDADIGVLGLDDRDLGLDAIERRHIRGTTRLRDAEIYGGSAVEPLDGPAFRH